jgi:hypothetical protein
VNAHVVVEVVELPEKLRAVSVITAEDLQVSVGPGVAVLEDAETPRVDLRRVMRYSASHRGLLVDEDSREFSVGQEVALLHGKVETVRWDNFAHACILKLVVLELSPVAFLALLLSLGFRPILRKRDLSCERINVIILDDLTGLLNQRSVRLGEVLGPFSQPVWLCRRAG